MQCKLVKKSPGAKAAIKAKVGEAIPDFQLQDNQDGTFTIFGQNAAGQQVDISSVATLTPAPTSSDPTVLTVDTPTGMSDTVHALKAGSVTVNITATWNDGSVGPFTIQAPVTVISSPVTGITIQWGTPTVRP